jgi:hypothetical protein
LQWESQGHIKLKIFYSNSSSFPGVNYRYKIDQMRSEATERFSLEGVSILQKTGHFLSTNDFRGQFTSLHQYRPKHRARSYPKGSVESKAIIRIKHNSAASRQNQHSAFATSMDPDQPAHPHSLIRIHVVRNQFLYLL